MNVYDVFKERGFVEQASDEAKVREMLSKPCVCYIGFDPTSDSFHVGSLVPIMALAHMQQHGHTVIVLIGGGTAMIGDPSGRTELRKLMTKKRIDQNAQALKKQLERFIDFSNGRAMMLDNAEWLMPLNFIEFLRDIGRHFSVNRMLAAESYRQRMETGLNFIEFNYMLLQAYDFLHLYKHHDCTLQMGGNDQWGNMLAGADLIRRVEGGDAEALTFPLLLTSSGAKMGKSEKGAVWLDPARTTPYEYYQYWINTEDRNVAQYLALFTFLPTDEVERLASLAGADLRQAKAILAYEVTKINHGEEEAIKARSAARALFRGGDGDDSSAPSFEIPRVSIKEGVPAFELFALAGLVTSKSEARRLIKQGGAYINGRRVEEFDDLVTLEDVDDGVTLLLRAGKKKFVRVVLAD